MILIKAEGKDSQHALIVAEAVRRGYRTLDTTKDIGHPATVLISPEGQWDLLVQGIPSSWTSMQTRYLCDNKHLTKLVFQELNIPAPENIIFQEANDSQVADFLQKHTVCVGKPQIGDNGIGVRMNLRTVEQVAEFVEQYRHLREPFMLESQVTGQDLRIQVIGGKIVAACIREPAHVIGDGYSNLNTLVQRRQKVIQAQNPANQLILDEVTLSLIKNQGLSLEGIPDLGQKVVLKNVSNIGQGGIPIDVTDRLHPVYHHWVELVGQRICSSYFALDIVAISPENSPEQGSYAIEINSEPSWYHHTFSEVRTHNLAPYVMDHLARSNGRKVQMDTTAMN